MGPSPLIFWLLSCSWVLGLRARLQNLLHPRQLGQKAEGLPQVCHVLCQGALACRQLACRDRRLSQARIRLEGPDGGPSYVAAPASEPILVQGASGKMEGAAHVALPLSCRWWAGAVSCRREQRLWHEQI